MNTKKVTVYSQQGLKTVSFETTATTWGQLKPEITKNNPKVQIELLKATVGFINNTLVRDDAMLPETDFQLFLTAHKTNSGGDLSHTECMARIREIKKTASKQDMHVFFGSYQSLLTEELNERIEEYEVYLNENNSEEVLEPLSFNEKVLIGVDYGKFAVIPITEDVMIMVKKNLIPAGIYVPKLD